MKHSTFREALDEAVAGLELRSEILERLATHWELVCSWNARSNLTAITDPFEAAWLHYRDSLEAAPLLPEGTVVDIGSGAGFPGFVLGLAQPARKVVLIEPQRKRASFLEAAIARISASNVRVLEARLEDEPDQQYASAVTRATFSRETQLRDCLRWADVLLAFRSGSAEQIIVGSEIHKYALRGQTRHIEIVRRAPEQT